MIKFGSFLSLICLLTISCKDTKTSNKPASNGTERLEIYDVKGDSVKYEKDSLVYIESTQYDDGKKIKTIYYNPDGTLKGKEIYKYEQNASNANGSEYRDASDSLLSYYKFIFDNKNVKISSFAFDAKSDEMIRIEKYAYDSLQQMIRKEIFDANNVLNRTYTFQNDDNGNQIKMIISGDKNQIITTETYKITKYDDQKKWLEKWGFVNGQPKTYHIKTTK